MRYTKEFYKTSSVIQDNIKEIWNQRTYKDYQDGKDWYKEANKFSLDLAEKFQVAPVVSAGVLSALSPQKEWNDNKSIVEHFFQRVQKAPVSGWRSAKHYMTQKRKAWRIYKLGAAFKDETLPVSVAEELHGLKTVNFFHCINNPTNTEFICVDRHQIFVALGEQKKKLTTKQYEFIKKEYLKFAESVNMIPCEMQGILWLTYKRIKKI